MSYIYRTGVPNALFDLHLSHLGYAELKVLLVIIRQTYGWINPKTKKRKQWDWISKQFFIKKTGLSGRAVSSAISNLVHRGFIAVKNERGEHMRSTYGRKRAIRLYYSCSFEPPVQ